MELFSEEIINVLDYLGKKLGMTVDWTSANVIPYITDLCGRYIKYEIATSAFWMGLWGLLIIWGLYIYQRSKKTTCKYPADQKVIGVILMIMGIIGCIPQALDIIQCIYLPEAQIYHYLKTLVENSN